MDKLPIMFRSHSGEVTAVFPSLPFDDRGGVTCYAHVGQHGGASWGWVAEAREATPDESAALLSELQQIYSDSELLVIDSRGLTLSAR